MSNHLPECPKWYRVPAVAMPCICDRLRDCETRMLDAYSIRTSSWQQGYDAALNAAREAVERVSSLLQPLGPALAAIDALREGEK